MKDNFYKSVTMGIILAVGIISFMACLIYLIQQDGHPNQSNATIEAIHKDTTQRNKLQTDTNTLLGEIKTVLEGPILIECE